MFLTKQFDWQLQIYICWFIVVHKGPASWQLRSENHFQTHVSDFFDYSAKVSSRSRSKTIFEPCSRFIACTTGIDSFLVVENNWFLYRTSWNEVIEGMVCEGEVGLLRCEFEERKAVLSHGVANHVVLLGDICPEAFQNDNALPVLENVLYRNWDIKII